MSGFIEKQKRLYKSFEPCFCSAIQDFVHFTADGLNHLLYNRRRPRSRSERHYRAALISHIVTVIKDSSTAIQQIKSEYPLVTIWILEHTVTGRGVVKVILRKEGNGKVRFLSAMAKKTKRPRKNS